MKCGVCRGESIEAARGGPQTDAWREHLQVCGECAEFYDAQVALSHAMAAVAADVPRLDPAVEARMLAEVGGARLPVRHWVMAAGIAAGVMAMVWWSLQRTPAPAERADSRPFLTIPYTVPLSPEETVSVYRTEIPVAQLEAAGFHVQAADPAAVVEADVLVSQDGRARAIRPLSISITN